jgi:putative ABC transport system substrate-binding protein
VSFFIAMHFDPTSRCSMRLLEQTIAAFARTPNGRLISTSSALAVIRRDLIVGLAAKHKLPAVYHRRLFTASGGLISYGPDIVHPLRRAAS